MEKKISLHTFEDTTARKSHDSIIFPCKDVNKGALCLFPGVYLTINPRLLTIIKGASIHCYCQDITCIMGEALHNSLASHVWIILHFFRYTLEVVMFFFSPMKRLLYLLWMQRYEVSLNKTKKL